MENASKALIMAASILVGVMIISVGAALFKSFSGFSSDIATTIEQKQIAEFNSNFYKYYGNITTIDENNHEVTGPIKVTAHDIIGIVNSAKQNNAKYQLENETGSSQQTNYLQVIVIGKTPSLEKWNEDNCIAFLKENIEVSHKSYKCTAIETNDLGRVNKVTFKEI